MAAKSATSTDALVLQEIIKKQPWRPPAWGGMIYDEGRFSIKPFAADLKHVPLWIWEMPQEGVAYTLAIDPSASSKHGADPAAIQILRGSGQAAEVRMQGGDLHEQVRTVYWLGAFYNWASVVVEMNGLGDTFFHMLRMQGYKNLWYEQVTRPGWKTITRPGWTPTIWSRPVMRGQFLSLLVSGQMALRSQRLLEEMQAAAAGDDQASHDLMDAYAIGCAAQSMPAARG